MAVAVVFQSSVLDRYRRLNTFMGNFGAMDGWVYGKGERRQYQVLNVGSVTDIMLASSSCYVDSITMHR